MEQQESDKLRRELADPRVGVRRRALARLAPKARADVEQTVRDRLLVPLLRRALSDPDRIVKRHAARALRPWIRREPRLLDTILPEYATDRFDGMYTHIGLYDVLQKRVWIPRFAALKGHASLLADGDTDRYFKFQFYVPGQAPAYVRGTADAGRWAHLVLEYIPDWSYSEQRRIPDFDERGTKRNIREQDGYGARVMGFYREAELRYGIKVHRLILGEGPRPRH